MSALGWWLMLGCTTPPPADPGVLLVITDGVRGDRVGRAAAVGEMPTLDALAAAGTRFDRAYTVSTSAPAAVGCQIPDGWMEMLHRFNPIPRMHGARSHRCALPSTRRQVWTCDWWRLG